MKYRPEILHTSRGQQYAKLCGMNFEFPPLKIWHPSKSCVCITVDGTKNFKSPLLEFLKLFRADIVTCSSLQWRKLILTFPLWEIFLTRFFSIFVCFTHPLIFLEPLKLAHTIFTHHAETIGLTKFWATAGWLPYWPRRAVPKVE